MPDKLPPWAGDEHSDAFDPNDPIPQWEADWMAREIGSSIMTPEELLRQTALKSNGRAGEEMAEYWFRRRKWRMFKVEPPVRNLGPIPDRPGHFEAVYTDSGMPDFFGFLPNYQAVFVEVKEAHGKTWPASKLTQDQRNFMAVLPGCMVFTGLLWDDIFEMFPFIPSGSYKKGEGLK